MEDKITRLRSILDESSYTVALCGSSMLEEGDFVTIKTQERAYEIEQKYGYSFEEIYSSAVYNTRPELFFSFYKQEMLLNAPKDTEAGPALLAMEQAGKLQYIITGNVYAKAEKAGCKHVLNLHGSIYDNRCPRCGKTYPVEYMINASHIPVCEVCNIPVRPMVSLYGEMTDSQRMTKATEEIGKADTLLLLGTTLDSDVFSQYIKYFQGRWLVIIHQNEHYRDHAANLLILDQIRNVLPKLGY